MAKKKNNFDIIGTFSIHNTDAKSKKSLIHSIKEDCYHIRNMLILLRNELYEKSKNSQEWKDIYYSFLSNEILRETIYGRKGKDLKATRINQLRTTLKNHAIFNELCEFSQKKLDPKNFISIINEINKNYDNYFTQIAEWKENTNAYTKKIGDSGIPKPPKAKKLKYINQASLMVESSKWSLKKISKTTKELVNVTNSKGKIQQKLKNVKKTYHYVRIKVGKKAHLIPINWTHFPIPDDCILRSLNISHSNGSVYLNFSYGKPKEEIKTPSITPKKKEFKRKEAGGDVGLVNTLSVFVNDIDTPSFIFSGKKFIKYNCEFNRFISRLNTSIAKEAIAWKEVNRRICDENGKFIKDENGEYAMETTNIAIEHTELGESKKKYRSYLFEKRNRFYHEEFEKLSTHLSLYLKKSGVTDFVISKNLSFAKAKGSIKMHKKTQQKFYQIPFGMFLGMVERKCEIMDVLVHDIDEAHTSKTSCLTRDVNEMVLLRKKQSKSLSTNDYNGSRVKRGLYKDYDYKFTFNSDINGAINHLKVKFKELDFRWLLDYKSKLCNPLKFKSDRDFVHYLKGLRLLKIA